MQSLTPAQRFQVLYAEHILRHLLGLRNQPDTYGLQAYYRREVRQHIGMARERRLTGN